VTDPATDDALVEVPVHAAVLRATADLLDLLNGSFTGADSATRTQLGRYLVDCHGQDNTTDSTTEAVVMLGELAEAAELLRTLCPVSIRCSDPVGSHSCGANDQTP